VWVRVLGSAAGGGFPQWNCACRCCQAVRDGSRPCKPRTQSSLAVSSDYRHWYLLNASPDLRVQLASFPPLQPTRNRHSPIRAVLLTDAELDHSLGLLMMREAEEVVVYATKSVHSILELGTGLLRTLRAYTRVDCRVIVSGKEIELEDGLSVVAIPVPVEKQIRFSHTPEAIGTVCYRILNKRTGGTLVYAPSVQHLTPSLLSLFADCTCLFFDGTFWQDDEMFQLGVGNRTAVQMGHLPISGSRGSLEQLSKLAIPRKIYIHINNTNPILLEDAPERRIVEELGFEVAYDGLELEI